MSPTTLLTQMPYPGYYPTHFDDDMINVPQAQDAVVYAGYAMLDEELGLVNNYTPSPLRDEVELAREYDHKHTASRNLAAIKMEALDDGTGRIQGSDELLLRVKYGSTRMYDDVAARDESLQCEHLDRMYVVEHCVIHSARRYASAEDKVRYADSLVGCVPRTVHNPVPIVNTSSAFDAMDVSGLQLGCDGLHPTDTLRKANQATIACIDPVLLDSSAWSTDYRVEGLSEFIDYSSVADAAPAPVSKNSVAKKRSAPSKKIGKAVKKQKSPKKISQDNIKAISQMVIKVPAYNIRGRRASLAAIGNICL